MAKILHAQELEVFYIIPAMRRELSRIMKDNGIGQKEIARRLGVSEAAVSQYFSSKRAKDIRFSDQLIRVMENSAEKIVDTKTLVEETQTILAEVRNEKIVCCKCHEHNTDIPPTCNACFHTS